MRLAQIMAGAETGGAELFFERLTAALARAGDEVLPVIRRDAGRAARLRAAGLDPVQLGFGGPLDILTRPRLARRLRRFGPAVAVAWMGRAARHTPRGNWTLVGRLGGYYDLKRFARCDHLVANTRGLVDWITNQGFAPDRVHYLPNFAPDHAGSAPAELALPPHARIVLAMGRLHKIKGFDVLLHAITQLPGVHAVIAGEGEERGALEGLARRAGIADRVHFLGWRHDTASLLAACDVLACPSRGEPLGNVVLDAFSAGKPVVATATEGPGALIDTGRTGILVPVDSGVALASGLGAVLADAAMAARLGAAGRANFEAEHAEAPVLARWRSFLASVAA